MYAVLFQAVMVKFRIRSFASLLTLAVMHGFDNHLFGLLRNDRLALDWQKTPLTPCTPGSIRSLSH